MTRFAVKLLGAFAFLFFAIGARAQSSFTIPVQNQFGVAITGATVVLTCTDAVNGCHGLGPFSATSSAGNTNFTAIPSGNYTVVVSGPGIQGYSYSYTVALAPTAGISIGQLPLTGTWAFGGTLSGNYSVTGNETNTGVLTSTQLDGCQHVNANQSFAAALSAASSPGCIAVDPGTYTVSVNAAIGTTVSLISQSGGILSIANAVTLTINGPIIAPSAALFAYVGTGVVSLGPGAVVPSVQATWFPGADIGAQLNNAYAALPASGATITVPPASSGCYSDTTQVAFNTSGKYVLLQGLEVANSIGSFVHAGTCINYTPTTATTFLSLDYVQVSGSSYMPTQGVRDLTIINNACTTNGGCGSSATGIAIGVTNGGAQRGYFSNNHIEGFGTGFLNGNGVSWGQTFLNNTFTHNTTGISLTTSPLEQMMFAYNDFVTNATDFSSTGGADVVIQGGSWDGHTVIGYSATGTPTATFIAVHFENFNCTTQACVHYINSTGQVSIFGGVLLDDSAGAANRDYAITVNNAVIRGLTISSASETFTNFVAVNGFADMQFMVASANLTPCPTFATSTICAPIGTGVAVPYVRSPTLRLGTTAGDYTLAPTAADSGHTATFPAATGTADLTSNTTTTTTQVLHGSATAGVGTWSAIATGDLPTAIPIGNVGSAGLSGTSPVTINAAGAIGCATCVVNNGTNTGTAAMTLNMAASTTANSLVAPAQAGLTSGTNGAIAYDTTNNNTHIRTNAADSIAVAEAAALAANVIPKQTDATHGLVTTSLFTDDGTTGRYTGTGGIRSDNDLAILTTDFTDANASGLQAVTGLNFTLVANTAQNRHFDCNIMWSQATNVADTFGVQDVSLAPTRIDGYGTMSVAGPAAVLTNSIYGVLTNLTTTTATGIVTATPTVTTVNYADLHFTVQQPSGASSVIQVMVQQATAADVIVVKAGSACHKE